MVVPEEREGKTDIASDMLRDASKPADSISSRKGGGQDRPVQRKVSSQYSNRGYALQQQRL